MSKLTLRKLDKIRRILKRSPSTYVTKQQVKKLKSLAKENVPEARYELAIEHFGGNVNLPLKTALKWALEAAESGDARNMINVGYCYAEGIITKKDNKKAVFWFQNAAKKNIPFAFYNLAKHFEFGEGVNRNPKKAFYYYKLAASVMNKPEFNLSLGWCYEHGFGTKINFKKALRYYKKAVVKGDISAAYNLGLFYLDGKGVIQSTKKAIHYFTLASRGGHSKSHKFLGLIYMGKEGDAKINYKVGLKHLELAEKLKRQKII